MNKHCSAFLGILTAVSLATGCKRDVASQQNSSNGYFKPQFQSESQFIVTAIVSDLAEQIYYAAKHQLPEEKYFSVTATEKPGSPTDTPSYELIVNLDKKHAGLKLDLNVNGPIWSPDVYRDVATALAGAAGLSAPAAGQEGGTEILADLLDGTAATIEQENHSLSYSLEQDFANAQLHEQAALLLGAFLLREHSGYFFEIRSPLSRITAHLAMARFLSGTDSFGVNGKLAEAIMLTLAGDAAPALDELKSIDSKDTAVNSMIRALQARNTGDFRPLSQTAKRSQVESVAWFMATADYASTPGAWRKLDASQQQNIDFVRAADEENFSVEMGHQLLDEAIPLELQEIQNIYEASRGAKLDPNGLVKALNQTPEHCFTGESGKKTHVRIIGWGQWAMFFQRHLCQAVKQNFYLMNSMWGVPDDAKKFSAQCDQQFDGLLLYPFVRRFNCTDEAGYHKSVDDGFGVTVTAPQLVPAQCWNYLCYNVKFAPPYNPNPNPHINEWHNHNPLPGTVYDLRPRLNHPSLVGRGDLVACLERLHGLSPYDLRISNLIIDKKYGKHPTYDQAMALYHDMMPWSVNAVRAVADTVHDDPEQYEKVMLPAAELDPTVYFELGNKAIELKEADKAAQYFDKGCANDPDAIGVANYAEWRVRYYLKKGQTTKAREIADFAGEVYSSAGLVAKAVFMEETRDYDGAFEWYAKNEERYNQPGPLISFCQRYKALTGNSRFDAELKKREKNIFPKGRQSVSLADFRAPPADGVLVQGRSPQLTSAGMKMGDVIVAIHGFRVQTMEQLSCLRDEQTEPELDLIVWQGDGFHEIKASPPNRRFGVNMVDYKPN